MVINQDAGFVMVSNPVSSNTWMRASRDVNPVVAVALD